MPVSFEGKTPGELEDTEEMMTARFYLMIASQN